jgi:SAM-dependent methyltransferase
MYATGEEFCYDRCSGCSSLWLRDPPADLAPYYPQTYYSVSQDPQHMLGRFPIRPVVGAVGRSALLGRGTLASAFGGATRGRREVQTLLSIYRSVRAAGLPRGEASRVLDVGAGSGLLVYAMSLARLGEVAGVDPFGPPDRRFDTGAWVRRADLSEVDGTWDLVMLHHTLEHVPSPADTMGACRRLLGPGARVVVRSPTVSSWAWTHYREDWAQFDAPRHLAIPSRAGMDRLADRCSLRVVWRQDDSSGFQFWGSEQVRRGIALYDPDSVTVSPSASPFSSAQLTEWARRADKLNALSQGDQVAWVLEPV